MSRRPRVSEVQAEVYPHDVQPPLGGEAAIKDDTVNDREIMKKDKKNQRRNTEQETGMSQLIEGLKAEVLEIKKLMLETVEATKKNQT